MRDWKIKVDDKYVQAGMKLVGNEIDISKVKCKTFRSFSYKYIEERMNEFLKDVIYFNHVAARFKYDTSSILEFSDKTELYNYVCHVYYMEWPF